MTMIILTVETEIVLEVKVPVELEVVVKVLVSIAVTALIITDFNLTMHCFTHSHASSPNDHCTTSY